MNNGKIESFCYLSIIITPINKDSGKYEMYGIEFGIFMRPSYFSILNGLFIIVSREILMLPNFGISFVCNNGNILFYLISRDLTYI